MNARIDSALRHLRITAVTALRLFAIGVAGLLVFGFAGGGVTQMEEEFDKAVVGLYHAAHPDTLDTLDTLATVTQPRAHPLTFTGACDGSAAVMMDGERMIVANDEDNVLRVYDATRGGAPTATFDLAPSLQLSQAGKEADIEGAAAVGDTVFGITSHAPNPEAKPRPNRYRLFAVQIDRGAPQPVVAPVGRPYTGLLDALASDPALAYLVARRDSAPERPGAINIEGLAAARDGTLLIGFRNPVPAGRAVLLPLHNPLAVLRGARPQFGALVTLDLGGRGVRSIDWVPAAGAYLIIAGPSGGGGPFAVYRWSGAPNEAPTPARGIDLGDLGPEAIVPAGADGVLILADDGDRPADAPCKDAPQAKRSFRGLYVPRLVLP